MAEIRFRVYPPPGHGLGAISIRVFEDGCEDNSMFSKGIIRRLYVGFEEEATIVRLNVGRSIDGNFELPERLESPILALCRAVIDGGIEQPLADFVTENQFELFGENVL